MPAPNDLKRELRERSGTAQSFQVGDTVKTADRGNFGKVVGVQDDRVTVHFENPDTGRSRSKTFSPDQLTRVESEKKKSPARTELPENEPIKIISGADLLATDLGPDDPIIPGLLGEKESLLVTGSSGIGKSVFTSNLALVLGKPPLIPGLWGLFPIPKPVSTVFIQSENGIRANQRRLQKIIQGAPYLRQGADRLFFPMVKNDIRLVGDLQAPEFQETLKEIIETTQARLLCVDPLISYHWQNENDNAEMRKSLDCLTMLCDETGASCLVVHHVGKNGLGARGASAIEDWAANILALEEVTMAGKTFMQVTHRKARNYGKTGQFFLQRTADLQLLRADPQEVAGVSDVVEIVKAAGGSVEKQADLIRLVVNKLKCCEKTARSAIGKTQSMGQIEEFRTGKLKGYRLPDSGTDCGNPTTIFTL